MPQEHENRAKAIRNTSPDAKYFDGRTSQPENYRESISVVCKPSSVLHSLTAAKQINVDSSPHSEGEMLNCVSACYVLNLGVA